MSDRRYEEPQRASAGQVADALAADVPALEVARLLVGAALHDPDWRAVQDVCLRLLNGRNDDLAAVAATSLGHLARIHGTLDVDAVALALRRRTDDPVIGGRVRDALDDIHQFVDDD